MLDDRDIIENMTLMRENEILQEKIKTLQSENDSLHRIILAHKLEVERVKDNNQKLHSKIDSALSELLK